jgi:hypothetical protein
MRICKPPLLLRAVACIEIHAFGQSAIDGQTINLDDAASKQSLAAVIDDQTNGREAAGTDQTFATYIAGSITKPSAGQFNYIAAEFRQTNGTGWGRAAIDWFRMSRREQAPLR